MDRRENGAFAHSRKRSAKSTSKRNHDEAPEVLNWIDSLNQAIDNLSESRITGVSISTREESLEVIVNNLACHLAYAHIEHRIEEMLALLKRSLLKNGTTKEACLAARAIALTFINLEQVSETEADDLYRRILPSLRNIIKDSDQADIKVNCLQTLSLITYTSASDIDKQLVRNYLFDLIETDGADFNVEGLDAHSLDQFLCAAVHAYGVLYASSFASGFVDFEVLWEELEKVMPVHEIMLESSDKSIRIASGENIALMFETANIFLADDDEESEDDKPEYDNLDGLIHTLKQLSMDSSKRHAKSDRAEQKSVFRDIVKSVEGKIRPEEELRIEGKLLSFRGWAKILPLNAFRRSLGQGFQHHLRNNSMMKSIFHYKVGHASHFEDSDEDDAYDMSTLSNVDRKYIYGENKKMRSKQIRNARITKEHTPAY
ncbi:Interferon-related developmental regulator 1 [Choanephora cucurbitarum]|uniref:Interferon-related developmental regulator 1 n=1 Tax=Choanephora cucurbitarum TaxID=101091 RepID=A0A1C7NS66_9FUNG|nr:Interferon-related developmental regulator 1 [Choanephora cucurbitarum]